MKDLKTITKTLRAAVDCGDLGRISEGVAALERLESGQRIGIPDERSGDAVRVTVQGFSCLSHRERCIGFFESAGLEIANRTGVNDPGPGLNIETKIADVAKLKVALMDVFMQMDDSELEEDDLRIGVERWQMTRKDRVVLHDRYAKPSMFPIYPPQPKVEQSEDQCQSEKEFLEELRSCPEEVTVEIAH